jgi:hypothetical protein
MRVHESRNHDAPASVEHGPSATNREATGIRDSLDPSTLDQQIARRRERRTATVEHTSVPYEERSWRSGHAETNGPAELPFDTIRTQEAETSGRDEQHAAITSDARVERRCTAQELWRAADGRSPELGILNVGERISATEMREAGAVWN